MTATDSRRDVARLKLLTGYAIKFAVDAPTLDPTDANLTTTLAGCAKAPDPADYPKLRLLVHMWNDAKASVSAAVVEALLSRAGSYAEDSRKFSDLLLPGAKLDPLTEADARRYADTDRIIAEELRKIAGASWPDTSRRRGGDAQ